MSGQQPVHPGAWGAPAAPVPPPSGVPAPKISTIGMVIAAVLPLGAGAAMIGVQEIFDNVFLDDLTFIETFEMPFLFAVGMIVAPLTTVSGLVVVGFTIATLVTRRRALLNKALVATAVTLAFPLMVWVAKETLQLAG